MLAALRVATPSLTLLGISAAAAFCARRVNCEDVPLIIDSINRALAPNAANLAVIFQIWRLRAGRHRNPTRLAPQGKLTWQLTLVATP